MCRKFENFTFAMYDIILHVIVKSSKIYNKSGFEHREHFNRLIGKLQSKGVISGWIRDEDEKKAFRRNH